MKSQEQEVWRASRLAKPHEGPGRRMQMEKMWGLSTPFYTSCLMHPFHLDVLYPLSHPFIVNW